ncbi:arginine exporter protein ArgO [Bordetella ansorpii]|jgi:L-lysine exporter family protein LysE/ArgO|uniref:Arginine exporter protein ArgO n=1 Tax=Bordetella ansorpii TaxID=288768 RepID=A0A157QZ82_9BORD|nr:LysE family transporter [Bordetella ansorpii]SAI50998.1 arginine exporter protein ArgO [Bordetella ansorpii]
MPFTAALPPLFSAWLSGTATGLGLFAVVGAQSAYILRQGLMRAHLGSILALCALLDALFIFSSVLGLQVLTHAAPWLTEAMLVCGVAFLGWYALQSARRALRAGNGLQAASKGATTRRAALLGALGFTLVNPHFWLDIVLVGTLAHSFGDARMAFASGALTASALWLAVLGLGARLCAPLLASPRAWRVLDGLIALVMATLAVRLAMTS